MTETTLYDARGTATAYVGDDGTTIRLWKGKAVSYLVEDKVYSWRGRHQGWFVDGVVYDGRGRSVGYTEEASPVEVGPEPVKPKPAAKSARAARTAARPRPALSPLKSELALGAFLQS